MAKKKAFPTKTCPKCSKPIHARLTKHEDCGWVMEAGNGEAAAKPRKKRKKVGRPRKVASAAAAPGGISVADIQAVKSVVDRLGAAQVRELAGILK